MRTRKEKNRGEKVRKKTLKERIDALPLDLRVILAEDLESTIEAHLTVFEREALKNGKKDDSSLMLVRS